MNAYYAQWDRSDLLSWQGIDEETIREEFTEADFITEEDIEAKKKYELESESQMSLYGMCWRDFL